MRWLMLVVVIGLSLMGCGQEAVAEPTMRIVVGETADFPEPPYRIHPYNNEIFPKFWLTIDGKDYYAVKDENPVFSILSCSDISYWVSSKGQFEDGCSGAKFNLDGTYIEGPAYRNLYTYPVEIINGKIFVDFGDVQGGEYINPQFHSIYWTKSAAEDAGYASLEHYLEQAGYLPYTKDK